MIIETTLHTGRYALVKTGRYKEACIIGDTLGLLVNWGGRNGEDEYPNEEHEIKLPPGNWIIVGIGKDLTEEQWEKIVDEKFWIGGFGWRFWWKGNVQFILHKTGTHGHKKDYWYNFDPYWWNQFKLVKK